MCKDLPFKPFVFISGTHGQTILGSFISFAKEPKSVTKFVVLPDGDEVALEVSTPDEWKPGDLTVMMVHGLCGSHRSGYLIRMTKRLLKKNIRCIRFNMRGCGTGKGHAKYPYHSGRSDDLLQAIEEIQKETPDSEIVLMGFSLGGNVALKLAGEMKDKAKGVLRQVIAVCPPADLLSSVNLLSHPVNRFYEKYFMSYLRAEVKRRHKAFRDLPSCKFPRNISLYEFDEAYTAPLCGFNSALEYYEQCSSKSLIPEIQVKTKILFSMDDPLIDHTSLDDVNLPESVTLYKTERGGHLGYLGAPRWRNKGGFHWMDHVLEEWIFEED